MKTLKKDWLTWIMLVIPFVFVAYCWNMFPDQIATHFDMDGNPNDYSGKVFGALFLPVTNLALYFVFSILPLIDPKRNYSLFSEKYKIIRIVLHSFLLFVFFVNTMYALGYQFNIGCLIMYGVLALFLVLGNYMGNVRPNYFIGVRTPWTLSSDKVWMKTHRMTARLWVISTIVMMIVLPLLPHTGEIFIGYIAIISLIPVIYSFLEFRKEPADKK